MLKKQQWFKSEKHNIFNEEINKIRLSSNDNKRMRSIDLIGTYTNGMDKELARGKEESNSNKLIKRYDG